MSWFSRVAGWFGMSGPVVVSGSQSPAPGAYPSTPAKPVTFDSAMQLSAFWASVRLISETVACLPVTVYRVDGGKREEDRSHWLWQLLAFKPNRYQTRIEFFECLVLNLCVWGNAYNRIARVGDRVVALVPMQAAQVETRLMDDGKVVHLYHRPDGVLEAIAEENVWHVKLFGNGVVGMSPLAHARNALGIAQASEDRVSSVFRNGAKPSGILMVDQALSKSQREAIRASFSELAESNEDSLVVLDKFMKYQAISMSPEDVELLASRRFQLEDVARFMGVPSVLINDTSQSTVWGSGIQQLIEGSYKLNFRPYLERIELSARVHLLDPSERERYELEFDFDSLLRVDQSARMAANQTAINSGQLTPNEARAMEGRGPMPGGDTLYVQGAMVPLVQPMGSESNGNEASGF